MTLIIDERRVGELATTAAQRVLDRLRKGLIDEPQDDRLNGTAREIEEMIRSVFRPDVDVWNRAWDL